jgi:hypothetical protein
MPRRLPGAVAALGFLAAGVLLASCAAGPDDPLVSFLERTLRPGDRLLAMRVLDPPEATRVAVIIGTRPGKPELRIYETGGDGAWVNALTQSEGDQFKSLSSDDVNADGKDEVVVSWLGGHLEIMEVITRGDDGRWSVIFQNAGREIERRYDSTGAAEYWITSRTYDEAAGEPPAYATTVYRWTGDKFATVPGK